MEKPRAVYFTAEEQTVIMSRFEDLKHIIKAKSNTVAAAKSRQSGWQQIADSVNAQQEKKDQRKTGGGPPPAEFTPAEELALSNKKGRPLMVGVEGGFSTDPGGSSSHHLYIQDDGENVVLVPLPNQQLPHTEEGLDDDETLSVYSESALAKELFLPRSLDPPHLGPRNLGPHEDK
ncbi:hypothetical protein NQZ68_024311 [Dissostichus eleginoides]|nr:hypothetical protein NQZ68_024311 [Dissostichus eleginoides]